MFEYEINGVTYSFNCKLNTTVKIKNKFNKSYMKVLEKIDDLDTMELIKFLYCGIDVNEFSFKDFSENLLENIGMMELYNIVQMFAKKTQYPNLSFEEIDIELEKEKRKNGVTETA